MEQNKSIGIQYLRKTYPNDGYVLSAAARLEQQQEVIKRLHTTIYNLKRSKADA